MKQSIYTSIDKLLEYAEVRNLINAEDEIWARNQILSVLGLSAYEKNAGGSKDSLVVLSAEAEVNIEDILTGITDYAAESGIISDDTVSRDLLDTKLMGIFTDRPSTVNAHFDSLKKKPEKATEWFYSYCKDINYIRTVHIAKDRRWKTKSIYGDIDITINLSKPEKDPAAIALAKNAPQTGYPACQLCMENEGYEGRANHPARGNLRIIPMELDGEDWGFQYSPYSYYDEHCIVLNSRHTPMCISEKTFRRMFAFLKILPHYFVGSNADLPIVGGSILSHDHFQGGRYSFAIEKAGTLKKFKVKGYEDVRTEILIWPMSAIRIRHKNPERLTALASHILEVWRGYSDPEAGIYAMTDGTPHNTITPIARRRKGKFELDLILRNNITSEEHPLGVFHPHGDLHHIKKENIGLIEAMGLAVLPSRLDKDMEPLREVLLEHKERGEALRPVLNEHPEFGDHTNWIVEFTKKYKKITEDNVDTIIETEIGNVFVRVLEDSGVFKCNKTGRELFYRFMGSI